MSLLKQETINVFRKTAGYYVNGHYIEGDETEIEIEASVQPLTGNEFLQLAEGDRYKEAWKVFSVSEIRANDAVTRLGKTYEVRRPSDYSSHSIPHYEAVMVLVEGQT